MALNGTLHRLENSDCVDAYATAFQSTYGSVILVTDNFREINSYEVIGLEEVFQPTEHMGGGEVGPFEWICEDIMLDGAGVCRNYLSEIRAQVASNSWEVGGYPISHCLSEISPEHCKLQHSLPLAVAIIVFNLIKAIIMCYVALTVADTPILTTGDAISSFMMKPDQFSRRRCLLSMEDVESQRPWTSGEHITYHKQPKRWASALPPLRWAFGILLYVLTST